MRRSINYVFSTKIWIFIWFLFFSTPILRANSCHPDPNISCWPALDVRTLVEGINYDHFRSVIYMSPGNVGYSSAMELFQNSHGWDLNVVGTISQDTNGEIENTYDGGHDDIEAVFKVVFNEPTSVLIAIKPEVPEANLDLFVVQGERPSGNFIDVDSAFDPDIDVSAAAGGNESVARVFAPGTYYILVSLLEGDSCATTSFGLLLTERPIYLNCFNVQDDVSRQMVSTWVDPSDYNGLADWSWLNWTGVKYGPCLAQNPGDDLGENSLVGSKILAIPNGAAPIIDFDVALFTEEPLPDEPVFSLFTESKNSQSLNYVSGFSFASGTSGIPMTINGNNGYLFPWSSWRQTVLSLGGTENEFTLSPCSGTGIVLNGQNQNEMWLIDNLRVFRVIETDFAICVPDPNFKAFLVAHYDSNGDGEIQLSEAGAARGDLNTPGNDSSRGNISDLTGIEHFTGISSLNCSYEQLSALPDLSALGNLNWLYCDSNQLTDIPDVTSCNSLCHFDCAHNYFGPDDCAMIDAIEAMGFSGFVYSPNANDSIIDCALPGFTLTASADSNGSITPSGTFEVFQGNTVSFYMIPDSGYAVLDVVVDGSSMGPQYVYTFTNIQANHAISVTFQPDFTITTIPDPNFKAFLVAHYDSNGDGEIQASEAGAVRDTLYTPGTPISPGNISDLTGIEYFTGISNLYCPYQQLTTLPVSNLINLQKLYCYYNQLNTLPDLSALVNLQYLYCESNQLTTLPDLSALVNLQYLYCESNQLTTLPDLSALVNLQYLYCESNQLTTLPDLSALANLYRLDCHSNQLTTLPDLSALGNLQRLYCSSNQLTDIPDVTGCHQLRYFYCDHNHFGPDDCAMIDAIEAMEPFVYFTYSPNANGSIIDCSLPTLTLTASSDSNGSIDPSGAVEVFQGNTLSFYMIPNSGYTVLDAVVDGSSVGPKYVYTFTNIQANHTISVTFQPDFIITIPDPNFKAFLVANYDSNGDGEIQASEAGAVRGTLDTPGTDDSPGNISDLTGIEYFTGISTLISSNEQLTALPDLAGLMNLQWLDCSSNQLSGLPDLSTLGNLQYLDCSSNQLTTLPDLSTLGNLQYLYCDSNQLTTLPDLSALANLYWLYCSSNQLTMLPDLAGLEHLYRLDCSSNQLTTLPDLVGLEYLYRLDCSSNQLTALPNLSDLANLLYLYCDSNQLTTLPDLSALRNLKYLYCSSNQLTTLPDLFVLRHLQYLDCSSNQLTTLPDLFVLWNLYWFDCDHNQLTDIPDVTGCNQLRYFYCDHNHFGPDDCAMINAIKAMRIWEFVYSPNADGSVIDCTTR